VSKEATTKERRKAPLETPTDLGSNARRDIAGALNALLADTFALYLKTKNFHSTSAARIFAAFISCSTSTATRSSP
jgi:hypothetical protein